MLSVHSQPRTRCSVADSPLYPHQVPFISEGEIEKKEKVRGFPRPTLTPPCVSGSAGLCGLTDFLMNCTPSVE